VKVLVAGVGNVLRGDDGFGVAVVEHLANEKLPDQVRVMDVGIGGIHLVQELMAEPVDVVVVVDAVEMDRPPGTILVIRPLVEEVEYLPLAEKHDRLADMHYSTPDRALMLANAVGALPEKVWVIGCEPLDAHSLGEGLSEPVEHAIVSAIDEIRSIVRAAGIRW
jgi:hydrogenase maturation protease